MQKRILLIIPAYNEEKNILKTVAGIDKYNKQNGTEYDYIVINDCSTDNTEKLLKKHNVPHISLVRNLGIGGAVQTGYRYAQEHDYSYAVQFDGDNQHDVTYVDAILAPLKSGSADLVIGSRFIGEQEEGDFRSSFSRRLGIKLISRAIRFKTHVKITDTTSGFRASNQKVIDLFAKDYPVEYPEPVSTTSAILKRYKVKEVPVKMRAREAGSSSIHSYKNVYFMINVLLLILTLRKES